MTDSKPFDAIVIGGGHNGLSAAAILAKAGKRTLLLEANETLGGMAELATTPGHVSPTLVRDLELERHGLRFHQQVMRTHILRDGSAAVSIDPNDHRATHSAISGLSGRDADRWPEFQARMARLAGGLAPFLEDVPPRLKLSDWRERWSLGRLGFAIRRMGRADMRDLLRILPMNVADLAEEEFESDALRGLLSFDAVVGNKVGARSPNTVFTLMMGYAGGDRERPGAAPILEGGPSALVAALEKSARAFGTEIKTDAPVERILIDDGAACGVRLGSGQEISADIVVSGVHPKTTLLDFVGPAHLDTDFTRAMRYARGEGMTARLDLTLDRLPADGAPLDGVAMSHVSDRLVHAPDIAMVERAFDAAKYGELPEDPPFEMTFPQPRDASVESLRASILVQYTPRTLKGRDWEDCKAAVTARLVDRVDALWPGFKSRIEAADLVTPKDVEQRFGAPGGHWHHLELGLDQAYLLRPVPGWAQYTTPIDGLFLCGAGTHPGGGVTGRPGMNGARVALDRASKGRGTVRFSRKRQATGAIG